MTSPSSPLRGISEAEEEILASTDGKAGEALSTTSALAHLLDSYDDIPAFLNDVLSSTTPTSTNDLTALDRSVSDILTRLSILSQDTSSQLERSIHDISRTVPRLTYDLQFMRESAAAVRQSLQSVQDKARLGGSTHGDTDSDTKKVLDRMTYLDTVKTRMEEARDVLREAESWSSLEQETTTLLANSSYRKAANRLAEASTSIQVFQNTPAEYTARNNLLVSLQNQLEARLNAVLTDMIKSGGEQQQVAEGEEDQEEKLDLKDIHDIYGLIERDVEFREAYFAARRSEVLQTWESVQLAESNPSGISSTESIDGSGPEAYNTFLPRFFASLQTAISTEVVAIPKIFPDPVATLVSFLQTTYEALNPSFSQRLEMLASHHGALALPQLIAAWKATTDFVSVVRGMMDTLIGVTGGDPPHSVPSPTPIDQSSDGEAVGHRRRSSSVTTAATLSAKRASRRFSRPYGHGGSISIPANSNLGNLSRSVNDMSRSWEPTFLEPFLDYQADYGALERKLLAHALRNDAVMTRRPSKRLEAPKLLLERITRLQSLGDEAIGRCMAFTYGYALTGLVHAVDFAVQTGIRDAASLAEAATSKEERSTGTGDGMDELDDLGSLDYSEEDWASFQLGLHMLQACRAVREKVQAIEQRLRELAGNVGGDIETRRDGIITPANQDISHTAIGLLQQTSLHSTELQNLLERPPGNARSSPLLPDGGAAVNDLTRDSQLLLQRIILAPLRQLLDSYAGLSVWSQPDKAARRGDLQVPTFSLSPTDTITHVSEGLLNLLRLFEVYASDSGLGFSLETLPFIDQDALRELTAGADQQEEELRAIDGSHRPLSSPGLLSGGTSGAAAAASVTTNGTENATDQAPPPELVLSSWVSSLSLSLLCHLTKSILPSMQPPLTTAGSAQLATDLGYLSNAVRALDVEWDELERWREASECRTEAELRGKISALGGGRQEDAAVFRAIGRLRGWPL